MSLTLTCSKITILLFLEKNCLQDMGLNDGSLIEDQIHLTTVFRDQFDKYGKAGILLDSDSGWKPATNSIQEYITVCCSAHD